MVFVINEHAKVMVKSISLIGAIQVPADELKAAMLTKEGNYLSFITQDGTYREEMFQRDLAVIEAAYYDRGYLNVKVGKPSVSLSPDKKLIFIDIRIEEGDPFRISKVDFSGDLLFPKEQLFLQIYSRAGEYFSRALIIHDDTALAEMYQDLGFAYANWSPETAIDPVAKTVALTFTVQKGKPQNVETISIVGNTKTRDRVIRRQMRIYEGELFRGSGVRVSKERITALGFFETVEINYKPGSDDSHVAVTVEVKEKSTGSFQVGAGFSSVESFIFTAQVSQSNFLGWGNTASISAQISGLRQLFTASFFEPYFWDTDFIFTLDLFRTQVDSYDFTRESAGGAVGWGYHLLDDLTAAITYTLEYVSAIPGGSGVNGGLIPTSGAIPSPANRFRSGRTSSARLSLTYDKRDNRLYPTKGMILFGSVEYAPDWLGGNFNFVRFQAYTRFYVPLPLGMVFKTQFTVGYIAELDPSNPLPISEQYLLGGINSLRGYALNSISPTVLIGTLARGDFIASRFTTGGNKEFIANIELEFPIVPKAGVRGVIFLDAGNVFATDANFFQDRQYRLPARPVLGHRLRHPLVLAGGPVALRVGHPTHAAPAGPGDSLRIHHWQLLLEAPPFVWKGVFPAFGRRRLDGIQRRPLVCAHFFRRLSAGSLRSAVAPSPFGRRTTKSVSGIPHPWSAHPHVVPSNPRGPVRHRLLACASRGPCRRVEDCLRRLAAGLRRGGRGQGGQGSAGAAARRQTEGNRQGPGDAEEGEGDLRPAGGDHDRRRPAAAGERPAEKDARASAALREGPRRAVAERARNPEQHPRQDAAHHHRNRPARRLHHDFRED